MPRLDQATHPSEQDGLISGLYLDRIYDAEWYASKTSTAWDEYWRAVTLIAAAKEAYGA